MESFYGDPMMQNNSGQGPNTIVPPEIKKWNWGAFFLHWIWGIGNRVWVSFFIFVPIIGWVMPFILGYKGSEWAWQKKQWQSVEHFQAVQKKWAKWGFIIFIISGIIFIILLMVTLALFFFVAPEILQDILNQNNQQFMNDPNNAPLDLPNQMNPENNYYY